MGPYCKQSFHTQHVYLSHFLFKYTNIKPFNPLYRDTMPTYYESWTLTCQEVGLDFPLSRFYEYAGMSVPNIFDILIKEQLPSTTTITALHCEQRKKFHHAQIMKEEEGNDNESKTNQRNPPIEIVFDIVRKYHNVIPIGIASSGWRDHIIKELTKHNLLQYFDTIVTVDDDDVEKGKPHPDMYIVAARKLGVDVEHCIGFEDADLGMQAISNAGYMYACDVRLFREYPRNVEAREEEEKQSNDDNEKDDSNNDAHNGEEGKEGDGHTENKEGTDRDKGIGEKEDGGVGGNDGEQEKEEDDLLEVDGYQDASNQIEEKESNIQEVGTENKKGLYEDEMDKVGVQNKIVESTEEDTNLFGRDEVDGGVVNTPKVQNEDIVDDLLDSTNEKVEEDVVNDKTIVDDLLDSTSDNLPTEVEEDVVKDQAIVEDLLDSTNDNLPAEVEEDLARDEEHVDDLHDDVMDKVDERYNEDITKLVVQDEVDLSEIKSQDKIVGNIAHDVTDVYLYQRDEVEKDIVNTSPIDENLKADLGCTSLSLDFDDDDYLDGIEENEESEENAEADNKIDVLKDKEKLLACMNLIAEYKGKANVEDIPKPGENEDVMIENRDDAVIIEEDSVEEYTHLVVEDTDYLSQIEGGDEEVVDITDDDEIDVKEDDGKDFLKGRDLHLIQQEEESEPDTNQLDEVEKIASLLGKLSQERPSTAPTLSSVNSNEDSSLDRSSSLNQDLDQSHNNIDNARKLALKGINQLETEESTAEASSTSLSNSDSQDNNMKRLPSNDDDNFEKARQMAMQAMDRDKEDFFTEDLPLSEKQILQSILLAEDAAINGHSNFSTKDKIHYLERVHVQSLDDDDDVNESKGHQERTTIPPRGGIGKRAWQFIHGLKEKRSGSRGNSAGTKMLGNNSGHTSLTSVGSNFI
jgi:HAD superfamily hydrolase (TIGR01509 family)